MIHVLLALLLTTAPAAAQEHPDGLTIRPEPGAVVDLRGVTVRGMARGGEAKSLLSVQGFDGVHIRGGRFLSDQDPQEVPWVDGHKEYGAGIIFKSGRGPVVVENALIADSLQDGITLSGGLPDDVTFELRSSWITGTSDDGIQNDGGKRIVAIVDSMIEAKMGLSVRPGRDSGQTGGGHGDYNIPIRDSLINVICVADDRPDGSDRRNPAAAENNNCGPGRSASGAFKWSGAASGVGLDMRDSMVRYEARNRNGWQAMGWPSGTYENVTLIWDPVQEGMRYEGPALPDGVTMLDGEAGRAAWREARAGWLARHGCDEAALSCTWEGEPPPPPAVPEWPLPGLSAVLCLREGGVVTWSAPPCSS